MSFLAKRELLARVAPRYQSAPPQQKSVILDEFVAVTGYARKYAIRLLAHPVSRPPAADPTARALLWSRCAGCTGRRLDGRQSHLCQAPRALLAGVGPGARTAWPSDAHRRGARATPRAQSGDRRPDSPPLSRTGRAARDDDHAPRDCSSSSRCRFAPSPVGMTSNPVSSRPIWSRTAARGRKAPSCRRSC